METPQRKPPQGETKPSEKTQLTELFDQIKAIPWTSIWSLALAIGGLFLIVYFCSIGFLPDLDLKAIAGTVVGVAVVGLFVVAVLGMGLLLPTLVLNPVDTTKKGYQFSQAVVGIVCAFAVLLNASYDHDYKMRAWFAIVIASILLCAWLTYHPSKKLTLAEFIVMGAKEVLWGSWALMIPMLYYVSLAHQRDSGSWVEWLLLLAFPAMFALLSIVIASLPEQQRGSARLIASVVAVFFLGLLSNRPALVSQATIAALGLSVERQPVTLVLSETGCNSVNLLLDGKPCSLDVVSKLGSLSNVKIISRIGAQVVVHWKPASKPVAKTSVTASTTTSDNWLRAILRKEDVISWAYDYQMQKKEEQSKP